MYLYRYIKINEFMRLKLLAAVVLIVLTGPAGAQFPEIETELDRKVKAFLEENARNWKDMNVPLTDGRILYDIVIENNYRSAVEIGTSTGHSAIWIAWALSKTGGKLITIEIDKQRYLQARANFKQAGLLGYIDVRLGNAHELVPALTGRYDFVFNDADKYWYKNYFTDIEPKIAGGGCFVAHNVTQRTGGVREFLDYIEGLAGYETTVNRASRSGLSISYKTE